MDHKEQVEKLELLDQLVREGTLEKSEIRDQEEHWVLLDHKEKEEIPDLPENKVAQVSQGQLVRKDCLDHRVLRVNLANRDQKEAPGLQENWEHLDPKDTPVPLEQIILIGQ